MKRLPVAAFVALAIVTAAAFFFIQHLKVSTPLIAGQPSPHPSTINPVSGGICPYPGPHGKPIPTSHREMKISFYLLNRNDDVDVFIVKPDGVVVDTLATDVAMVAKPQPKRHQFIWNGRLSDGKVAPDGTYDIKVALVHQGRSYVIADASTGTVLPVTVQTKPPAIRVTSVSGPGGERPAVIPAPGGAVATIHYAGTDKLRPQIQIYRSSAARHAAAGQDLRCDHEQRHQPLERHADAPAAGPAGHVPGRPEAHRRHLQSSPVARRRSIPCPARPRTPA